MGTEEWRVPGTVGTEEWRVQAQWARRSGGSRHRRITGNNLHLLPHTPAVRLPERHTPEGLRRYHAVR